MGVGVDCDHNMLDKLLTTLSGTLDRSAYRFRWPGGGDFTNARFITYKVIIYNL